MLNIKKILYIPVVFFNWLHKRSSFWKHTVKPKQIRDSSALAQSYAHQAEGLFHRRLDELLLETQSIKEILTQIQNSQVLTADQIPYHAQGNSRLDEFENKILRRMDELLLQIQAISSPEHEFRKYTGPEKLISEVGARPGLKREQLDPEQILLTKLETQIKQIRKIQSDLSQSARGPKA